MSRNKLKKLKEVRTLPNVVVSGDKNLLESLQQYFGNNKLFTLEFGCGDGDFTRELAVQNPNKNFVGIDLKGSRIWNAADAALIDKIENAAFINSRAEEINEMLPPDCSDEIIIPFPDPHVKRRNAKRRLVSPPFIEIYERLLVREGMVHIKTDNPFLFEYAKDVLKSSNVEIIHLSENLYQSSISNSVTEIQSRYERHYIKEGRIIKYLCFKFSD